MPWLLSGQSYAPSFDCPPQLPTRLPAWSNSSTGGAGLQHSPTGGAPSVDDGAARCGRGCPDRCRDGSPRRDRRPRCRCRWSCRAPSCWASASARTDRLRIAAPAWPAPPPGRASPDPRRARAGPRQTPRRRTTCDSSLPAPSWLPRPAGGGAKAILPSRGAASRPLLRAPVYLGPITVSSSDISNLLSRWPRRSWLALGAPGQRPRSPERSHRLRVRPAGRPDADAACCARRSSSMRDVDIPTSANGFLDFSRVDRGAERRRQLWIGDFVELYENGQRLGRPRSPARGCRCPRTGRSRRTTRRTPTS